jgi:hypothetical protein
MMLCMPATLFHVAQATCVRSAVHRPLCIVSQWAHTCIGIAAHRQTAFGFLTPPYTHTAQGPYNPAGRPPGLPGQHQRKVKNTQIYEFYHFPKNGRMQCGL